MVVTEKMHKGEKKRPQLRVGRIILAITGKFGFI
jgi:hypothetical protein